MTSHSAGTINWSGAIGPRIMSKSLSSPGEACLTAGLSLREARNLQAIEGNPLHTEQIAMFEMIEREQWPIERRRAYNVARALPLAAE